MKQLTIKDKQKIVEMLNKYYTIDSAAMAIINLATENAEQMTELTLKAFSIVGKPKDDATPCINVIASDSPFAIVQIDHLGNKLVLVKAVNEVTRCGLKEAKDLVDSIVIVENGKHNYLRFVVGPNGTFSVQQWEHISKKVREGYEFNWHFV